MVVTDAKAVTYIMNVKSPYLRLNRWFIFVQSFDFIIRYRKGKEHTVPDCLSRPPKEDGNSDLVNSTNTESMHKINTLFCGLCVKNKDSVSDEDEPNSRNLDPYDDENLLYFIKNGRHVSGLPKKQFKRISKLANHFKFEINYFLVKTLLLSIIWSTQIMMKEMKF